MTAIQMTSPTLPEAATTLEAQDARWTAWKSKSAADDERTQRRVRLIFAVVLIVFVCVTLAVLL